MRAALGLPAKSVVILYVGNLLPIKNPKLLLESFARLRAGPESSDYRLVLAGRADGSGASPPCGGLGDSVVFAGRQEPSGIVARLMRGADVLALTSDNEGVPNVVLEAFATGLPVCEHARGRELGKCIAAPSTGPWFRRGTPRPLPRPCGSFSRLRRTARASRNMVAPLPGKRPLSPTIGCCVEAETDIRW
jgi:glycosyltransferase involved in cell wall biosynthesis